MRILLVCFADIPDLDSCEQLKYKLLCLSGTASVVPAAALLGDVATLHSHLEKNPDHVRSR